MHNASIPGSPRRIRRVVGWRLGAWTLLVLLGAGLLGRVGEARGGLRDSVPMAEGATVSPAQDALWFNMLLGLVWAGGVGVLLLGLRRERRFEAERQAFLAQVLEGRQLYQSLVDQLPMPLYRIDHSGRILFANAAFLQDLAADQGSVDGQSLCSLLPPDLAALHRTENAQVLGGQTVHRVESRAQGDSTVRWVEILKLPVKNASGEIVGIQGVTWDITDRMASEQRLQAAADKHRALVEATRDGYLLVDAEGHLLEVNDVLLRWLGYVRGEMVGAPIWMFDQGYDPQEVHRRLARLQVQGWDRFETQFRRRDGSIMEVECSISMLPEQGGQALGFLRDVGEEKAALQRLTESEERFRTLIEALPMPIFVHQGGRFVYCNPASLRLLRAPSPEALMDLPVLEIVHPEHREAIRRRMAVALAEGRAVPRLEEVFLRFDGTEVPVEVEALPVTLWGKPAVVAFAEDLTGRRAAEEERRRMEDEVQHAQRLESLGHLAGGVAHDMNNVLAAILGLASTLRTQAGEDVALAKAMEIMVHAAERGRDLVKGLTDFARKGLKETRPVDLNEVVRSEAALLNRTTLQKVDVVLDLAEPLPPVLGDPHALGNALMNLCVNALDAMPEGGTLLVRTRAVEGGHVELRVADTGEGMAPEVAARAMEPFYTTKPVGRGTGLGLSVVYGTVKAHGGAMEIDSHPGEGTRITLRFPALAGPLAAPPVEAVAGPPSRSLRILLVDDDDLVRGTVPEMLGVLGHDVVTAAGGLEALERMEGGLDVDLVILDLNMPGMNGTETLRHLRELRPGLPVLVASGFKDADVDRILARYERVEVLMKPYTLEEFRVALGRMGSCGALSDPVP